MDTEIQTPIFEVILRVATSDEIVICVFDTDGERYDVVVGTSDQLLFETHMAILREVVNAARDIAGWQPVLIGGLSPFIGEETTRDSHQTT